MTVPADGVTLRSLGYLNGPAEQFTLPRTALVSAAVDQPNNVTAVLTSPPPAEVEAYLRRALPATGFTITADGPDGAAMTFPGHGWTGSFTASDATSAILLRPELSAAVSSPSDSAAAVEAARGGQGLVAGLEQPAGMGTQLTSKRGGLMNRPGRIG